MRKRCARSAAKKILCLALSVVMVTGSFAGISFAGENGEEAGSASQQVLFGETAALEMANNDRSVETTLCLKLDDELIKNRIHREDVVLGGVFKDMFVSGIRHDKKTILLDLVGVPDFSGEDQEASLQGTVEFPGTAFGCDDNIGTSVEIVEQTGADEAMKPAFHPYLDAIRDDGDAAEMYIILLPIMGSFAEDFDENHISFGRDLKDAKITGIKEEDGSYAVLVRVPKEAMKEGSEGYSCFGSVILSPGSMVNSDGILYDQSLYAVREFSQETVGRDLTGKDIETIQGIVGGFGNTTAGTIFSVLGGGISAASGAYTVLGWCGVFPTDASRHAEIMNKLAEIQATLNDVYTKCDYMSDVLDQHTQMITAMNVKIDQQYVGKYNASFKSMVELMDTLESEIQDEDVQAEINAAVERVAEKYQVPVQDPGRAFDEDEFEFDDLSDFYEDEADFGMEEAEFLGEEENFDFQDEQAGSFEGSNMDAFLALGDLIEDDGEISDDSQAESVYGVGEVLYEDETDFSGIPGGQGELFAEDNAGEEISDGLESGDETVSSQLSDAFGQEEAAGPQETEQETESHEASIAPAYSTVPQAVTQTVGMPGTAADEDNEDTADVDEPEPDVSFDEEQESELIDEEQESELPEEEQESESPEEEQESEPLFEEETEETEAVAEDRVLEAREMKRYLLELDREIGQIYLSGNIKIGDMLKELALMYSDVSQFFTNVDSSNPITSFCDIHSGVDNFKTTSVNEEMLYEEYLKAELVRALTILQALDSPTLYNTARENLNKANWPDVTIGTKDKNGNPYCYLMEGYVRLATVYADINQYWDPLRKEKLSKDNYKLEVKSASGKKVSLSEFYRRMHGRTLEKELELAGITNLAECRKTTFSSPDLYWTSYYGGITFEYERWGEKYGYQTYPLQTNSKVEWTPILRYRDDQTASAGLCKNDYVIVSPDYIRWTKGLGDRPAKSLHYKADRKYNNYYYPVSTLMLVK